MELAARKFLTAHAILLSLQGVPGIYFHSLFGSRGDRAGAEASGIPRRINREKLDRARLEAELGEAGSLRGRVWRGLKATPPHPRCGQRVSSAGGAACLGQRRAFVCRVPNSSGEGGPGALRSQCLRAAGVQQPASWQK